VTWIRLTRNTVRSIRCQEHLYGGHVLQLSKPPGSRSLKFTLRHGCKDDLSLFGARDRLLGLAEASWTAPHPSTIRLCKGC